MTYKVVLWTIISSILALVIGLSINKSLIRIIVTDQLTKSTLTTTFSFCDMRTACLTVTAAKSLNQNIALI